MPQCENIILGGGQENFTRILSRLEAENILPGKFLLIKGPMFPPNLLDTFDQSTFPRVNFGDLFMDKAVKTTPGKKYAQVAAANGVPLTRKSSLPPSPTISQRLVEPDLSMLLCWTMLM
jgi:hypothetical protein